MKELTSTEDIVNPDVESPPVVLPVQDSTCNELKGKINSMLEQIDALAKRVDELAFYTQAAFTKAVNKDKAFNILHDELNDLRAGRDFETQKPSLLDLLLIQDRISQFLENIDQPEPYKDFLVSIEEELHSLLARKEVSKVARRIGETFDPSRQKALSTEAVDCFEKDNSVLCVVRDGYTYKDRVLRLQEVIVGLHNEVSSDEM